MHSSAGMAGRELSFELLGVVWPKPQESMAHSRPPVGGAREKPWRQQDVAGPLASQTRRGPEGFLVALSSL